ncbi:Endonuclease/exonuclease/phosphatase [Trinorchestia longiramus]|nr:Endonuclease/exonuclease/phosphatase [Trinorchestia longiramus]
MKLSEGERRKSRVSKPNLGLNVTKTMRSEDSKVILVRPIGIEAHTFTSDPVALAQGIVKLGFAGTQCPSHIYVGFTRYTVFPFNAPPRRCYRCQRLGHVAVNCNSPLRCLVCSGPHTKDECTAEPGQEKCANCHQTHIASSKECPAIRNAAIQKLQCSGVGFEAAKHKVMKTQTELSTKAPFMKKQNLTVPTVSSNIMGSQHSIQGNQQENQNDLTIQEVMVDIHQSGGSYLWSDAEALPSTASSSPLYSSVVQGLVDLPSTSEHFQLSGVQERTPSMNITQSAKKPSPQMTTATECAEILSKSVASLGKKLEHQMKEMGREMGSRVIQRLSLELKNKMESVITEVSHTILSKVSSLLSELILANMQKEQPLVPIADGRKQNEAREMAVNQFNCSEMSSKLSELKLHIYATKPEVVCLCETWLTNTAPKPNFVGYVATWCPRVGGVRGGGLAILVRLDITFHHLRLEPFDGNLELQGVTLNTASGLMDIINESNPNQPFSFSELRHYLPQLNHTFLFLGDFNARSPLWDERSRTNPAGRALEEMLDTFPVGWKWGIWLPILKPGKDPEQDSSYRPICLLSCIGKLMECMIQRRLEYWVETNNLMLGEQAGFRRGKSTMDSLLIAKDFIANTFPRKQICVVVYFNLDGAYDSVWHEGIIYKLMASGLEKTYVKWLKNYLTGRTTSVRSGAAQSEGVPITWGLPQGAVLSPLLFNIMLSDLPVADGVQLIIYADITILSKGDSLTEVRACLQRYLDSLAAWF